MNKLQTEAMDRNTECAPMAPEFRVLPDLGGAAVRGEAVEDNERMARLGRYVTDFAIRGGWENDGEGAFEFVQRHSYVVGIEDAGKVPMYGGTDTKGSRWPITAFSPVSARAADALDSQPAELPPLPERDGDWAGDNWYTADSMRAYGLACSQPTDGGVRK